MASLHLPTLNAGLNCLSALFLTAGFVFIKNKNRAAHQFCMIGAVVSSLLFLSFYLTYHFQVGATSFEKTGWIRPVYFFILITHTVSATAIVPLVLVTLYQALRHNFAKHARIARWTWPIWMYVSLTGVLVYVLLYRI
ncbi:hypothetical protein BVX98_03800 [bacterium F11]|nr:hypothetical protein BVX98_03800 [bacterium F11]